MVCSSQTGLFGDAALSGEILTWSHSEESLARHLGRAEGIAEECAAAVREKHPRPSDFDPHLIPLDAAIGRYEADEEVQDLLKASGGINLGPAMTFGYIAARTMAEASISGETSAGAAAGPTAKPRVHGAALPQWPAVKNAACAWLGM